MNRKLFGAKLELVREEDYVEYFVFPDIKAASDKPEIVKHQLLEVQEKCMSFVKDMVQTMNYIWHKDVFQLIARLCTKEERLLYDDDCIQGENNGENVNADNIKETDSILPPHLYGVTHYGDNIADEWFIVYCLMKFSALNADCVIRVVDNDGEFLLIELADLLPKWANPETCEKRVYISHGRIHLVQNSPSNMLRAMAVSKAVERVRANPELYRISSEMQMIIDQRFNDFQSTNPSNYLHHQIVRIPINIACILKKRPDLVAVAVRAFCDRDKVDMQCCRAMRYFPPEHRIRMNVRFTRCLYAMLNHSKYVPDRKTGWNFNAKLNTEQYKEDLLGIKLACGFEILVSRAKGHKNKNENNDSDGITLDNSIGWQLFYKNLQSKGYFQEYLEHSEKHTHLLQTAKDYYMKNQSFFRTYPNMGKEILGLLQELSVLTQEQQQDLLRDEENNLQPSDSDDWLNISADELDAMLAKRYGQSNVYKCNRNLKPDTFTDNIAKFLDKHSTFEGIETISDKDEDDDEDSDNPDILTSGEAIINKHIRLRNKIRKNRSMRKACKQTVMKSSDDDDDDGNNKGDRCPSNEKSEEREPTDPKLRGLFNLFMPEYRWNSSNSEMSDYADEEDIERNYSKMTTSDQQCDEDIKCYMDQMDRELANTTIGKSFHRKLKSKLKSKSKGADDAHNSNGKDRDSDIDDQDFDDIEDFQPVDINVNTLRNMMDSYRSQLGAFGPLNGLLNAMGSGMSADVPDHDDSDEDEQIPESMV